jgi:nucleoside-diphosphate-sugar epimerase
MSGEGVNVLILGGLTHLGRPLLCFLAAKGEVKHVRLADKFLVAGSTTSTYVDPETLNVLGNVAKVEYCQANLTVSSTIAKIFESPDGRGYDYVFDLTGDGMAGHDLPNQFLYERTTMLAARLAEAAANHNVKAYVRDTPPFWSTKSSEKLLREEDQEGRGSEASTARAYYYYEAERAVANVNRLHVAIIRSANTYGPHLYMGSTTTKIALGAIYKYLDEPMKLLWSGDMRANTLHSRDWCQAAWLTAVWLARHTREQANSQAGVALPYVKAAKHISDGMPCEQSTPEKIPVAPIFYLADDDDVVREKLLNVIGRVYGIETGFTNFAINAWAKLNLGSVADDVNEKHAEGMMSLLKYEGLENNGTPISSFLSPEDLAQRSVGMDASKARNVLGWQAKESFDETTVKEVIDSFIAAGVWLTK